MGPDGRGTFAFEDERGRTDSKDASRIDAEVLRNSSVRCVFLNGCRTSQADVAGLCQALVGAGVPMAIGWAASVADDRATEFAEVFYRRLVHGESVPAAVAHAREAIRRTGHYRQGQVQQQDATFALPHVYGAAQGDALYDRAAPPASQASPRTEYFLLGDGIKGLSEGFIGRRRERQRLVPALRDGDTTFAVITGLGGAGKSTLATRAANRLQAAGFRIVPIRTPASLTPREAAQATLTRIIGALDHEFLRARRDDLHDRLTDGKLALDQRLRFAIDGLNELQLMVVLDNFEDALDLETRRIADDDLARFYEALAIHLVRGSRVIVTCRYLPEGTPEGQPTVLHLPLPEFKEYDVLKFLRRDEVVDHRIHRGELPPSVLAELYRSLGGTPGFMEQVRRVLRKAEPHALIAELRGGAPGKIGAAREAYFRKIIAPHLYDALPAESRGLVSRLAISELPLPVDAVSPLLDDATRTAARLEAGVAYGLLQRFEEDDLPPLYHPPGLLRPWLSDPARLTPDDARAVHRHLATFWRSCYESDRESELRVPIDVELEACRLHARRGDDPASFRWATTALGRLLYRRAEWRTAWELLEEIPETDLDATSLMVLARVEESLGEWKSARVHLERARQISSGGRAEEAEIWHSLATIDLDQGDYAAARDKFDRALQMRQAIGDRAGEAAAWHSLASIDLEQGDYAAARDKFDRALQMRQAIGDRAGRRPPGTSSPRSTWTRATTPPHATSSTARSQMRQAIGDRAGRRPPGTTSPRST